MNHTSVHVITTALSKNDDLIAWLKKRFDELGIRYALCRKYRSEKGKFCHNKKAFFFIRLDIIAGPPICKVENEDIIYLNKAV